MRNASCLLLLPLLVIAGCGAPPDLFADLAADRAAVPAYEVVDEQRSESAGITRQDAVLVVPEVTVEQATAALAQWANGSDADYREAQVVRSSDATTYVCSLRWAGDDRTAQVLMGATERVELNCPDPTGG